METVRDFSRIPLVLCIIFSVAIIVYINQPNYPLYGTSWEFIDQEGNRLIMTFPYIKKSLNYEPFFVDGSTEKHIFPYEFDDNTLTVKYGDNEIEKYTFTGESIISEFVIDGRRTIFMRRHQN